MVSTFNTYAIWITEEVEEKKIAKVTFNKMMVVILPQLIKYITVDSKSAGAQAE